MKNNILNILNSIINAKQNGNLRANPEFVLLKYSSPNLTTGICEHCKYFSIEKWDEAGGPVCEFFKKSLELDIPGSKNLIKSCIGFTSTDYKYCTNGNIDIRTLEIGDIIYEFAYGVCIKSTVWTKPILDEKTNCYSWECFRNDNSIIKYSHNLDYPHISLNLYNYQAYPGVIVLD